MSQNSNEGYAPGIYVKGDHRRTASSARAAVALVFEGYKLEEEFPAEDTSYRDLQEQAKALGIPANQSAGALREALSEAPQGVETVDSSDES